MQSGNRDAKRCNFYSQVLWLPWSKPTQYNTTTSSKVKKKTITNNPKYIDVYKKPTIAPIKTPQKLNHKTNQPGTHWQTYMYLQWCLYFTRKRENQKFSRCCYFLNAKYLPSLTLRLYYKTLSENLPLIIFPGKKLDQLYFDINCMHYSVRRLKSSKYNQFDPRKCV